MEYEYTYGYPQEKRINIIQDAIKNSQEKYSIEYQGKYRELPVIELKIEIPIYRIENIRTKSLQKEYLATHEDAPKDLFTADPGSIETQERQHILLKTLINRENLLQHFRSGKKQQTEPIICTDDGVVVNGNRRLCAWRDLYISDKQKYSHFQTVKIAVLPNHDSDAIYNLEVALQIAPTLKEDYVWHAIAADYKEKAAIMDLSEIAKKQGKKPEEISEWISCYDYATEYLEGIGRPNAWSMLDKKFYAFKTIVNEKRRINKVGDKELFKEIAKAILQVPAKDGRLYEKIPKIVSSIDKIADALVSQLKIELKDEANEDLDLLGDGSSEGSDKKAQIADKIRGVGEPEKIVGVVNKVLKEEEDLDKEKKKKSFIYDQVLKASTALNNAVSNLNDIMSKVGVKEQLDGIKISYDILKNWVDDNKKKL